MSMTLSLFESTSAICGGGGLGGGGLGGGGLGGGGGGLGGGGLGGGGLGGGGLGGGGLGCGGGGLGCGGGGLGCGGGGLGGGGFATGIAIGIFVAIAFAHTVAVRTLLRRSIASRNKLIAISLKTGQARLTIRVLVAITLAHAVRVCAQIILQINYVLFIDAIIIILFTLSRTPGNTLEFISLETLETGIAIGIFVAIAFAHTIAGSSIARRVQGFHANICAIIIILFTLSRTPGNTRISISLETLETGIAIGILVAIAFAHTVAGSSIARRVQG
ncbi:unnamed protein product [Bathycoccus prasinos]